jgi:hypothetical protein
LDGRQLEDAGFVGSCVCWVLDERNSSSSDTFNEAHKRDEKQLIANEQLGVFSGCQASNAVQVKDGSDWSWRFSPGCGHDGINDFPETGCAPSFAWGTAQDPVNNLAAYEVEIHRQVKRIASVVFLILTHDVNGDEAKEETVDPTQGIDKVGNVSRTAVSGIEVQNVEHGLENRTWNGVRERGKTVFK